MTALIGALYNKPRDIFSVAEVLVNAGANLDIRDNVSHRALRCDKRAANRRQ